MFYSNASKSTVPELMTVYELFVTICCEINTEVESKN